MNMSVLGEGRESGAREGVPVLYGEGAISRVPK